MGARIKSIILLVLVLSGALALTSDKIDGPACRQGYTRFVTRAGHYVRAHMGD